MKWKHQSGEQQEMESSTAERRQPSQSEVHVLTVNTLTLLLLGYDLIQLWSDTCIKLGAQKQEYPEEN